MALVVALPATAREAQEPEGAAAWTRLTEHAPWKLGGLALTVPTILLAGRHDDEVSAWAGRVRPLDGVSVVGSRSQIPVLLGSALGLAGWALLEGPGERSRARWRHLEIFVVTQTINAGLTSLLKITVRRTRPDGRSTTSFPSGHTSSTFAWATFVWRRHGWQWGVPAMLFAGFVGLSRIQDQRHYLSDVLAGASLGVVVAYLVDVLYGPDLFSEVR